jgi:hypothetical protein
MNIQHMYQISSQLKTASPDDVDRLESHFKTTFPVGYREYVTQLGEGVLNDFVRVYMPQRIIETLDRETRPRWAEYFLWDEDPELTKEEVLQSIAFADSVEGDELIFLPDRPEDIYLLARHSWGLPRIGDGLLEAIDWMHDGNLCLQVEHPYFRPFEVAEVAYQGSFKGPDRAPEVFRAARDVLLRSRDELIVANDENGIEDEEGETSYFLHLLFKPAGAQLKLVIEPNSEAKTYSVTPYTAPEVNLVVFHDPTDPPALLSSIYDEMESLGLSRENSWR